MGYICYWFQYLKLWWINDQVISVKVLACFIFVYYIVFVILIFVCVLIISLLRVVSQPIRLLFLLGFWWLSVFGWSPHNQNKSKKQVFQVLFHRWCSRYLWIESLPFLGISTYIEKWHVLLVIFKGNRLKISFLLSLVLRTVYLWRLHVFKGEISCRKGVDSLEKERTRLRFDLL